MTAAARFAPRSGPEVETGAARQTASQAAPQTAPQGAPLAERLASGEVLHLTARVTHARRGALKHAFTHDVDHVLLCLETQGTAQGAARSMARRGPPLFSRNRFNLMSVLARDHGGPRRQGEGTAWARRVLAEAGLEEAALEGTCTLALVTQPRFAGFWFAPVSFWLALRGDDLIAVIAEVNNTFGQRHSYLCANDGFVPIRPEHELTAAKTFHVSPFQDVAGRYRFRFDLTGGKLAFVIRQMEGEEGVVASMSGQLLPMRARSILAATLRRPGGTLRTVALIYWHALRLKLKGARFRLRPPAPTDEVSR